VNVSVLSDTSLKKQTQTQTLTLQKSLQESSNLTSSFDRIFGHLRSKSLQTSGQGEMNQFHKSSIAEETQSKKESKNNSTNGVSSPQKVTGDYPTGGTAMDP
jgi:hypothetical protein